MLSYSPVELQNQLSHPMKPPVGIYSVPQYRFQGSLSTYENSAMLRKKSRLQVALI